MKEVKKKEAKTASLLALMAGVTGFEPVPTVLESKFTPSKQIERGFFMSKSLTNFGKNYDELIEYLDMFEVETIMLRDKSKLISLLNRILIHSSITLEKISDNI